MTREEERIKQIEQFAYERYECYEDYSAFIAGAIWSDKHPKNVWHEASEEPLLEETEIIFINERDFAHISKRKGGHFSYAYVYYSWEEYVNSLKIKKWAYISDLLPKGSEK